MDILKAEIERKRKQIQSTNVLAPEKKYFKRGDLAAKQTEEYLKKHRLLQQQHEKKEQEEVEEKVDDDKKETANTKKYMLPRKEVIRRLRERGEPIRFFAESDHEAFQRLKKLEILEPEVNKGFKNDFKAAMDRVDQEYLNEIVQYNTNDDTDSTDVKIKESAFTEEDIEKWKNELGRGASDKDQEIILNFIKLILEHWGKQLNSRPNEEKTSNRGKLVSATHSQTVSYLRPLMRKLKKRKLSEDILVCLVDIVKHLLVRNYIKANDAYLEMAIGNAPWPIGVTMVGIHARTGREKIFDKNVAHVLNDETQRKYIQGLKRLMTKCQKFYPTDPSRMVDYEKDVT
ncbi:pre-mRNA-splicing factor 18-like [Tubulanus polymorphus]|uniref:pre-mRNA-splicing factor 18-like n=1 Tax=Tubulanus polymorphus TaxID=672921 RepID=UPI003DA5856F